MGNMKTFAFLLAAFALLSGTAFAVAGAGPMAGKNGAEAERGYYLDTRAAHLSCRVDFTTTVLDSVIDAVPQTSDALSSHSSKLKEDKTQLSSLAASGDPTAYNEFVSQTLRPDMTDAIKALASERKNYKTYNISKELILPLRDEYKSAHDSLLECEKNAVGNLGQARIRHYNAIIDGWQGTVDALGEKGIGTSAMQEVIEGAKASVISPLQSAVDTGDSEQVKSALRTYCLGNGCNGDSGAPYNYHGFAKINLERLQGIVDAGDGSMQDAQASLDSVRSTLSEVGAAKYTDAQRKSVWDGLREAAQLVRDYLRSLKAAATEG